ncbi:hypothetical protein [Telluribacter sp. SYSU D00476]|uniref:hypothetical protein n=1 Tax=Telluribacter sp. SYSU D00476 TaxID=2811430 RepID=UPI001FF3AA16|nr:hypothetical protein [Telluribacter sp. SYSU D00476]
MQLAKLRYHDFYNDYEYVDPKGLINDIPSIFILKKVALTIMKLFYGRNNNLTQIGLFKEWTHRLPSHYVYCLDYVVSRVNTDIRSISFIDNHAALSLVDLVLANYNDLPNVDSISVDQEERLFKAYMYCVQRWNDKQEDGIKEISKEESPAEYMLCSQFFLKEGLAFRDSSLQIVKSIYFFEFCEKEEVFAEYLRLFLNEVNVDSWRSYLKGILSLYGIHLFSTYLDRGVLLNVDEQWGDNIDFIDSLTLDVDNYRSTEDLLMLREFPLIKVDPGVYLILSMIYFVDKLYQGIQFDFARVLVKNKAEFKGNVIKSKPAFFEIFGREAEQFLFYKALERCFESTNCVKIRGDRFSQQGVDGGPDYYIRRHKTIFIFEFKNTYVASQYKLSTDINTIKDSILSKFCYDDGKKKVGVPQIVRVVKKLSNSEFNREDLDTYNLEGINVYPILVYVDPSLDTPGVNHLLNYEFNKRVQSENIGPSIMIKDLTLININSFIEFQDLFYRKVVRLDENIDNYIKMGRKSINIYTKYASFSDHLPVSVSNKKFNTYAVRDFIVKHLYKDVN